MVKTQKTISVDRNVENMILHSLLIGMENDSATLEKSPAALQYVKHKIDSDPANLTLCI